MNKLLSILFILILAFSCLAETPADPNPPSDMELAENALPLLSALVSSSAFTSFEEEVPFSLYQCVYSALELDAETPLFLLPCAEETDQDAPAELLNREITIEDAYEIGGGEVKVTLVVYLDGEFEMYCDVYLVYMQDSLYTSVISRAFIAE